MNRRSTLATALALACSAFGLTAVTTGTAQAANGHHYYVSAAGSDGNAGTDPAHPFRTIQKAADLTEPGDTVYVMNGTYSEAEPKTDVVTITRSGAPGAPITYRNFPGQHPVIHPITGWHGFNVLGSSYLQVIGLEFKGDSENLNLADAEQNANRTDPTYNTNCLAFYKDPTTGAPSHHLVIRDNDVHDCPGAGISVNDADYITIDRNTVHSTSWYNVFATSGISILRATDVDHEQTSGYKVRITNNVVHDNETKVKWSSCDCYSDGNGIIIDFNRHEGIPGDPYTGRTLVANNLSYDNGGSGIHSFNSQHVDIVNNTAYYNSRQDKLPYDGYPNIYAGYSKDVRLLNNISYARPGKATNKVGHNTDVVYDYNVYYNGLAPETMGPHDVVADPKFVSASTDPAKADFHVRDDSPALDSGTGFPAVPTDQLGVPRGLGGAYDRGVYENLPRQGKSAGARTSPSQ
ncbi:right-handed parallel beta-helix repeat-containing protein [Streptomyces sp. NPDC049954]|uniref:right-handed parallel beta-helix repeat-containing protein n=1 Tax=Streptomyces sp. NPDC049954 TaxID=3155779 RepID=UPI00343A8DA4